MATPELTERKQFKRMCRGDRSMCDRNCRRADSAEEDLVVLHGGEDQGSSERGGCSLGLLGGGGVPVFSVAPHQSRSV